MEVRLCTYVRANVPLIPSLASHGSPCTRFNLYPAGDSTHKAHASVSLSPPFSVCFTASVFYESSSVLDQEEERGH